MARKGLTLVEYAKHVGVSYQAVQKAIASKRITQLPDGSIDPKIADKQWAENTDFTKSRAKTGIGAAQELKVRTETALLQTKLKEKLGYVVPKGEVINFVRTIIENLKEHWITRGNKLAPMLANETDIGKIARIINEDARKMIKESRDDLERRIKSIDGQDLAETDIETGIS